jgi:benzoyl-CoA reductase subunit B
MNKNQNQLVGRGRTEGTRLFREWFDSLTNACKNGKKAVYAFEMGNMSEILRSFDFNVVFPEVNSLQTAFRRVADEYLNEAEDYGYSPHICGYVKADVAVQLRGGQHPMGLIPKPTMAVFTNGCSTYIKWAEIWERMYHIPIFTIDIPGSRQIGKETWPGDSDFERDRKYVSHQIQELINICEEITGKKLDIDKLRENMGYANTMNRSFRRVLELNQSVPGVFNSLTEGSVILGMSNYFRGSEIGAKYFIDLVEEMEYKAAHGIGTTVEEQHRLALVGVPCFPIFRRFNELFTCWGGNFIISTYLWFAGGGASLGFEYDLNRPLESLAEGVLISVRHAMDAMFAPEYFLTSMVKPYSLDGVVFHAIKSCRTTSTGLVDSRRHFMKKWELPNLYFESDMMDKRVVSETQLGDQIDVFVEMLTTSKQVEY